MNLNPPASSLPTARRAVSRPTGRVSRLLRLLGRLLRAPMLAVVAEDRIVYRGLDVSRARDLVGLASLVTTHRVVSVSNPSALLRLARNPLVLDGVRFVAGLATRLGDGRVISLLVLHARPRGPLSPVECALLEEFLPLIADALETEQPSQAATPTRAVPPPESPALDSASGRGVPALDAPGVVFENLRLNAGRLEGRFRFVEPAPNPDVSASLQGADLSLLEVDLGGRITGFLGTPRASLGLAADAVVGRSVFEVCAEWPGLTLGVNRALEGEVVTSLLRTEPRLELRAVPVRQHVRQQGAITGALAVLHPAWNEREWLGAERLGAGSPIPAPPPAFVSGDGSYASRLKIALSSAEAALEEAQRDAVDRERLRIARELHDGLGKDLFGLAMLLEAVAERQRGRAIQGELKHYADLVRRLGNEGRALLETFRQDTAPNLAVRLRALASSLESAAGVQVHLELPPDLPELNPHALHELGRVAEESLENIHRHAQARHAWVIVQLNAASLGLIIEDDGCGLPNLMPAGRFGLVGMRERIELLGGRLRVGHGAHGGVRLEAQFPLAALVEVADVDGP